MADAMIPEPAQPGTPATTEDKIRKLGDEIDALEKEALPPETEPPPIGAMF